MYTTKGHLHFVLVSSPDSPCKDQGPGDESRLVFVSLRWPVGGAGSSVMSVKQGAVYTDSLVPRKLQKGRRKSLGMRLSETVLI